MGNPCDGRVRREVAASASAGILLADDEPAPALALFAKGTDDGLIEAIGYGGGAAPERIGDSRLPRLWRSLDDSGQSQGDP